VAPAAPEVRWVKTKAAAAYLGISETALRVLARERRIRHSRLGRAWMFPTDALDAYRDRHVYEPVVFDPPAAGDGRRRTS
jgi:excisionase family DNA binding protein